MADDDRAVLDRLAALEAEVKADADAQRARKEVALAKVRDQRAQQLADKNALRDRQKEIHTRTSAKQAAVAAPKEEDDDDGIGSALVLAKKANNVRAELAKKGVKSWAKSGIASMALGPLGWLYAGSFREAIPASAVWLVIAFICSKIIPTFLLMPVLMVALPLSGIAGVMYALGYNKTGKRVRLFDKGEKKALKSG